MRLSEFRRAMAEEFGETYASVLMRDQWLTSLGSTGSEALDSGVPPREIWLAMCEEMQIPAERRYGRGLADPLG